MTPVSVIGAGPAGSCAARACVQEGCSVRIVDRSRFPRHKVCGEFFSPEIAPVLDRLGVWSSFQSLGPAVVRRMSLHFGNREKVSRLPEQAWGLSRLAYDRLLHAGLEVKTTIAHPGTTPLIDASGRSSASGVAKGRRVFAFKAHFTGPAEDCVELYFFRGCYVGINAVEGGITNVCGLGPEHVLAETDFEIDPLLATSDALRRRLEPMKRSMKWMNVGPLHFQNQLRHVPTAGVYPTGDALSFVDPFTGSGLLSAAITGELAGRAAARQTSAADYLAECTRALGRPFLAASLFRVLAHTRVMESIAHMIPGELLFRMTRPRVLS